MNFNTIKLLSLLLLNGCSLFQAPDKVKVLIPVAGAEIKHYERKMGVIATSTTNAYEKSETTRVKDNHWRRLSAFHRDNQGAFSPVYVKAQTIVLLDKLNGIHANTEDVKRRIAEINIHIDRAIQILELTNKWMAEGIGEGDAESIKKFFEEKSEEWLKIEKERALLELENTVKELEKQLEEAGKEE